MALLFMDGFDHYTGAVDTLGKWEFVTSIGQIDTAVARTGTGSLSVYYGNDEVVTRPFIATGGFIVGEAVRFNSIGAGNDFLRIKEDIIVHMALTVTASGTIQVKRGSTVLATGTLPMVQGTWNVIEFKGIIHATAGSFEVRVEGVTDPALVASGVNTRNGGSGQWNRVAVISMTSGFNWVDDFYVCDTSGPAPRNDFLGPVHVETLYPQTDAVSAGSNAGWTPSTGTDHGAMVDENPPNTTDYNASSVIGAKDTYQYPSLTFPGAVFGIQTNIFAQKTDTTGRQICAVVRSNSADRDGTPSSITTAAAYSYLSEIRAQNPTTSTDWTQADITALQVGVKVIGPPPLDPSIVLLIGADTAIVDESSYARTLTVVGNAARTTAQFKYGGASLTFDGTGDCVTAADSSDWAFGTGDFTIEGWFRFLIKTTTQALISRWHFTNGGDCWALYHTGGQLTFRVGPGGTPIDLVNTWTPTLGQWYHIAVDRSGTTLRLYVDGVVVATNAAFSASIPAANVPVSVGAVDAFNTFPTYDFNGQADEIRITKGVAQYHGAFTPTGPFPRN